MHGNYLLSAVRIVKYVVILDFLPQNRKVCGNYLLSKQKSMWSLLSSIRTEKYIVLLSVTKTEKYIIITDCLLSKQKSIW